MYHCKQLYTAISQLTPALQYSHIIAAVGIAVAASEEEYGGRGLDM